jgi:hypothetical protein
LSETRVFEIISDAVAYCTAFNRSDAGVVADMIVDRLIIVLRRDPRFPKLTYLD